VRSRSLSSLFTVSFLVLVSLLESSCKAKYDEKMIHFRVGCNDVMEKGKEMLDHGQGGIGYQITWLTSYSGYLRS
jgi:hypothetical protein